MYVRLGFAVAVNVEPDVLLIDEVLSVGDERFQQKCMERVSPFLSDRWSCCPSAGRVLSTGDQPIEVDRRTSSGTRSTRWPPFAFLDEHPARARMGHGCRGSHVEDDSPSSKVAGG